MKCSAYFLAGFLAITHIQCGKDDGVTALTDNGISALNCEKFLPAFEAADISRLKLQLDALSTTAGKIPLGSGRQGKKEKVEKLMSLINKSHCRISVDPQWWIIDTNPEQAEFYITSLISGKSYNLDFWMEEGHIVEFHHIHE